MPIEVTIPVNLTLMDIEQTEGLIETRAIRIEHIRRAFDMLGLLDIFTEEASLWHLFLSCLLYQVTRSGNKSKVLPNV